MNTWKKRNDIPLYVTLLIFILGGCYFVAGVFSLEGVSFSNYTTCFTYVISHPFYNWYNEYTVQIMFLGFILWVFVMSQVMYRNRNFHFITEHGSEQWANVGEMQKILPSQNKSHNRSLSQHIEVSKEKEVLSNNNMLIIGSSGSYKTTSEVIPNLLKATSSYVVLDVKGELIYNYGNYFMEKGYEVRTLNLKDPLKSDRYNPFEYIERETDLIKLITNLQESVKKPDAMSGEPFWDDGARLYLQAIFMYEWLEAKEQGRKGSMNNILKLVNYETASIDSETTKLKLLMDILAERKGEFYPPVRDYRKLKEGAEETVRSIVIMVNAMLALCEVAEIKRIFDADDMKIRELGMGVDGNVKKKVILFLVLPDNDRSFNFLISMFYTQMFDILIRCADEECHGPLPIEVEVWMDEFYAGAKPSNPDVLLGVVRSRNINMIPILQSISQIKTLFKNDKWETIMDNIATVVYLGSGPLANSTHEYISKALGKTTIDTKSDGVSKGRNANSSDNYQRMGRNLMEPSEVKRMSRTDCIIFLESRYPIYDKKAIPFDTPLFKYASMLPKYEHPIKVVYNEKALTYRTIVRPQNVVFLEKDEVEFYKEASKTDGRIHIYDVTEEEMLYLNWRTPKLSEEQILKLFKEAKEKPVVSDEQFVKPASIGKSEVKEGDKRNWDMSGNIYTCIKRYAMDLTEEEKEQILLGLEHGLTEQQIKSYFTLSVGEMIQRRRAYEILI